MTDQPEYHPATDADLLARFALGQLTEVERRTFESHLIGCSDCREEVEREMMLAAGIKRFGRQELKRTLGLRRIAPERASIPWPRLVGVAATLIVIAGVGLLLFRTGGDDDLLTRSSETMPSAQKEAAATEPPEILAEERPSNEGITRDVKVQATKPKTDADAGQSKTSDAIADYAAPAPESKKDAEPAMQAGAAEATRGVASGTAAQETGIWTEGRIIREPLTGLEKDKALRAKARDEAMPMVNVNQRAAFALPREQQLRERASTQNTIPTYARQVGTQLELTLYPDTLFPPEALENAEVRQIGRDSLLVRIGNQSVGYRIPQNRLRQQIVR